MKRADNPPTRSEIWLQSLWKGSRDLNLWKCAKICILGVGVGGPPPSPLRPFVGLWIWIWIWTLSNPRVSREEKRDREASPGQTHFGPHTCVSVRTPLRTPLRTPPMGPVCLCGAGARTPFTLAKKPIGDPAGSLCETRLDHLNIIVFKWPL